ncbi:MAG: sodium:solute symporter family transporter, partial [Christensenellales bacterium]
VLGLFLLLMAGVAIYSRSRAGNTSDFMLAGRNVGPWMSAFAYGTSYFSAVIFIGYASDLGRQFGLSSMWVGIGNAILGCLFAWLVLAGPTRRITHALDASTMPQFLAKRFECPNLQSFSAVIIFLFLIPYSASVYQGINLLFTAAFGIDANVCYILIACLTALYVFFGGYFGAALADFFQGSIMIGGVCLLDTLLRPRVCRLLAAFPKRCLRPLPIRRAATDGIWSGWCFSPAWVRWACRI